MASVVWMEPGTEATYDTSFYSSVSGTVVSATDQAYTGTHAVKLSTGSPAVAAQALRTVVLSDAGRRISFRVRFDTTPAAGGALINLTQAGGNNVFNLVLTTGLKLTLTPVGATAVTGATVLATNTWYRITISYTITNTTTYRFDVFINGAYEATVNAGTLTNVTSSTFRCTAAATFGANVNVWFDDIYIDDGSDYSDPGNIIVTPKLPNANGTSVTFDTTTTTTNSGYGTGNSIYLNQRPLLTTGARRQNGVGTASDRYTIESATTGDLNLTGYTQIGYMAWANCSGVSTDQMYKNGSAVTPDNATISTAINYWSASTTATYPSSADAIGMNRGTGSATDAILNECGIVIAAIANTWTGYIAPWGWS